MKFPVKKEGAARSAACDVNAGAGMGGLAFASSGADTHSADKHGEAAHEGDAPKAKGWVATDTYRVLNFAVLAGALVFLLRKRSRRRLIPESRGFRHN